jgi:predicted nucleotidyltransferase
VVQELFSSQARVSIMNLFLLNPDDRYYLRQVASLTGQPVRAAERELPKLEAIGLLDHTVEGNRKYYQVNRDCPIFPELKSIFLKTVGLGDALREYLVEAGESVQVAFIYGSYAKGDESTTSDIDLFVIGSISPRELSGVLAKAERQLRREVNAVVMGGGEFRHKVVSKNHFVTSLLHEPKIFLVGSEDELDRFAETGATP